MIWRVFSKEWYRMGCERRFQVFVFGDMSPDEEGSIHFRILRGNIDRVYELMKKILEDEEYREKGGREWLLEYSFYEDFQIIGSMISMMR